VVLSYVGLIATFGAVLLLVRRRVDCAGMLICLVPFALVTVLAWIRGGLVSPPAMTAYLALVLFASLCWGGRGAIILAVLASMAIGWFAYTGPTPPGMGALQAWAELSFQLFVVVWIAGLALRTERRAAREAWLLEGERAKAREAREALEARVARSQALEAVGRLAGGVAHDFNNLLTIILSEAELLRRSDALGKSLLGDVGRIEDAAERAAKLTGQLLAVGRKQVLSPVVLCPREVVLGLEPLLARLLPASSRLVVETDADTGNATVDETRLEQVLINLVTNASDSLTAGGTITVVTRNVTVSSGEGRQFPPGEYVEVRVSDTGEGMSAEVRAHIFEPFFTTKGGKHGTGLGLATVLGIVTQSGGYIEVDSALHEGSCFRVYFPRTRASVASGRAASERPASARVVRILLVEDEADVRRATRRILESLGHTVIDADSGQAAVSLVEAAEQPFDLLITDVIMPGIGGPALAERLRAHNPELRVLLISGYAADDLPHDGQLAFGDQYLSKPFSRAALSLKLAEVLRVPPSGR